MYGRERCVGQDAFSFAQPPREEVTKQLKPTPHGRRPSPSRLRGEDLAYDLRWYMEDRDRAEAGLAPARRPRERKGKAEAWGGSPAGSGSWLGPQDERRRGGQARRLTAAVARPRGGGTPVDAPPLSRGAQSPAGRPGTSPQTPAHPSLPSCGASRAGAGRLCSSDSSRPASPG